MRLLAIDPGGCTGFVLLDYDGRTPCPGPDALVDSWQIDWDGPAVPEFLADAIRLVDLVVIERFVISARTTKYTRQPEAFYVIGGAICTAELDGVPWVAQAVNTAKDAYPDARLKELGWFSAVKGKHARDALRHALLATHTRRV